VAAVVGAAAWAADPSPTLTAALAPISPAALASVSTAPTTKCGWDRFDLADSGVPGAGSGAVHRDTRTHAILARPGPHTQTLYHRQCPGHPPIYKWRASHD
jgi:hypothetical protein